MTGLPAGGGAVLGDPNGEWPQTKSAQPFGLFWFLRRPLSSELDAPRLKAKTSAVAEVVLILFGRDDRIRTCDPYVPNVVRYRAALHPVFRITNVVSLWNFKKI
jgi:hypothetical protein